MGAILFPEPKRLLLGFFSVVVRLPASLCLLETIFWAFHSKVSMANPQVSFSQTAFEPGSFWDRRRNVVRSATIPAQLDLLRRTGRYDAFRLQWHPSYTDPPNVWPVPNHLFWDSDVAKWIEGACYFLEKESDPSIDRAIYELVNIGDESSIDGAIEELVEMIQSAQQPDGYLNIHFTVVAPEERFTNLRDLHEL